MLRILEEREKEIADGLNAASEGKRELEEASVKKKEILSFKISVSFCFSSLFILFS